MTDLRCGTCGGVLIRRSPLRLAAVGLLMAAAPAAAVFVPYLWPAAVVSSLAGLYLLAWAVLGRGYWCRTCKRFGVSLRRPAGEAAASSIEDKR